MTTISDAWAAIQARAAAQITTLPLLWQHVDNTLPDTPAPFVYIEMNPGRARLASFGGGRGDNRWRQQGEIQAYVFVPRGQGLAVALGYAETVAAAFRSYRDATISCFGASVMPVGQGSDLAPPGMTSVAGNYACAAVAVDFFFDQIG